MIAIDARYIRERPSGVGSMVEALVRLLPPLLPNHTFLLLRHPRARSPISSAPNVREVTVRAEANGPGTLLWLPYLVDLTGVRLFHATFNILPAGLRMATLTTIHDVMWLTNPELCRTPGVWGLVETAFYQNGIQRALHRSTRLIAVSNSTLRAIEELDSDAGRRTHVIHHGIDPSFTPVQTAADAIAVERARSKYAPGAVQTVLAVGQNVPYKNHPGLVKAFISAFRDEPSTHLILIQRLGPRADELRQLARAAGAGDRVHVQSTVPLHDLIALYQGALCLCQPSFSEGWGMPVGEALACGCPVVASDRPPLPEVLGDAAIYVDPTSVASISAGLRRVSFDQDQRQSLVRTGLARAVTLGWEAHAQATAMLYQEILENGSA